MKCPNCNLELYGVYAARSVELQQASEDGKWVEKNVFMSSVSCPHCHEELPEETIEELKIEGY